MVRMNEVELTENEHNYAYTITVNHENQRLDNLEQTDPESIRRLLVSALDRFAKVGYHAATTREISLGAGMSPAALYVHFESKEVILFRLSRLGHESVLRVMEESAGTNSGPGDWVASVVHALTIWHCFHIALGRVAQYELEALTDEHRAVISEHRRAIQRLMERGVQQGVDCGDFDAASVRDVSRAILALTVDVVRWYQPDRGLAPETLAENYAELALRMLHS